MIQNKILIMIILASFFSLSLVSADVNSCNPLIKLVSQDPNPAIPDSYVKIIFELTDFSNCNNGFSIKLDPQYPFSLDPGANPIQTIEGNPFAADYRAVWMVPYQIRVAPDALEGDYNLHLLSVVGSTTNFATYSNENYFNISIVDAQTDFEVVVQEATGTQVSLGIVNTGKNTANSLVVGIPQQNGFRVTGTSEQIVGNLASGDYTIVSFNLASATNRTAGFIGRNFTSGNPTSTGTLKVQIDYTDGIGKRRSVVKEVDSSALMLSSGNSTLRNFNGSRTTNSTSKSKYYIILIILIIAGVIIYRKYGDRFKFPYYMADNKLISKSIPEWVLADRKHKKK